MKGLCKYAAAFGRPGEGSHATRVGGLAAVDLLATGAAALLFARIAPGRKSAGRFAGRFAGLFVGLFILLVLVAILVHEAFCVNTRLNARLFGREWPGPPPGAPPAGA